MANIVHRSANTTLSYQHGGLNQALLRCVRLTTNYAVNSEESHARRTRAFYPHRRSQGSFALTFNFKGWAEYQSAMHWFQAYSDVVLDPNSTTPPPVTVTMAARAFRRLGIPTTGIEFGDHTASMVFAPTLTFVSVSDPADPSTAILAASQASQTSEPRDTISTVYFYPDSIVNNPGKMAKYLYDGVLASDLAANAAAVQALVDGAGQLPKGGAKFI